jgi:hypothetical protein
MIWQPVLTVVLVLASAVYATWRLMPPRRRVQLIEWVLPATRVKHGWLARWRGRVVSDALRSCAGCAAGSATPRQPARKV